MTYVPLDRRFIEWTDEKATAADAGHWERSGIGRFDWPVLLKCHRVVLLGEAGSGKSKELQEQARRLSAEGLFAFFATVQAVARDDLSGALSNDQRKKFEQWRKSNETGYFFIDSVDEAKFERIRLEAALEKLNDGLDGAQARAHVVLSGRYTDWQFQSDLARFEAALPVPKRKPATELAAPDDLLRRALDNNVKTEKSEPPEKTLVVIMASLDRDQVRRYAAGRGLESVEAFLAGIEAGNLWAFAHRPLDLGWLVDFWRTHHGFGSLAQMLEASIFARLQEENEIHVRGPQISEAKGLAGLQRIGAAMVFGATDKIRIPEPAELTRTDFAIENILSDWPADERRALLTRAVFDAATFGRVQLHNDNEGTVRGYLAAQWLKRRLEANCTIPQVFDLLFADIYGCSVIRPSAAPAAAWLSVWEPTIAREVIRRDAALLLKSGDPASLPADIKADALRTIIGRMAQTGEWLGWIGADNLRRFATPDTAPVIRELWERHRDAAEGRYLLLQLIGSGKLSSCADLAVDAAMKSTERRDRIWAARALLEVGDDSARKRYASLVKSRAAALSQLEIGEAIEALFPDLITPGELINLLGQVNWESSDDNDSGRISISPAAVAKLAETDQLEGLLTELLAQVGPASSINEEETTRENVFYPIIRVIAQTLLGRKDPTEVPDVVLDASFRLNAKRFLRSSGGASAELSAELHRTTQRRRAGFWRAYDKLSGTGFMRGSPFVNPAQMDLAGWSTDLRSEDFEWLFQDAADRLPQDDGRLAFVSALCVWRDAGKPDAELGRLHALAAASSPAAEILNSWLSPPPGSAEETARHGELEQLRAKRAEELANRDRSWKDFVERLRADPDQLRRLPARDDNNVDARLFYFWQLLNSVVRKESRYQIDDVSAVNEIFGEEVTAAAKDALIQYWRGHRPLLESARDANKRNTVSLLDCMGITGISLEARQNAAAWAAALTTSDAELAVEYASFELNGFPTWFGDLACAKPREVSHILAREICWELALTDTAPRNGLLEKVSYESAELAKLVAPQILEAIREQPTLVLDRLKPAIAILRKGLTRDADRAALVNLSIERFGTATSASEAGTYLIGAFTFDAHRATDALLFRVDCMPEADQRPFCQTVFSKLFGDRALGGGEDPSLIPFDKLEKLVTAAYRTIKLDDDRPRKSGEVYEINERLDAEIARSGLFNQLVDTPGPATVEAIKRVGSAIGLSEQHIAELIRRRAEQDSERGPWPPSQACDLEREFDTVPQTASDLQAVALRRIAAINHDLHHDDFAQGRTVKRLPSENEVQIWVANELKARAKRAYTVERESQVVDGKMPDIRLRAQANSLPIEVKVAETWSIAELEEALIDQLTGLYLRHKDARHGILLLVYKEKRRKGWELPSGIWLSFPDLINHLQMIATTTAGQAHDAPKVEISVIDVSDITSAKPKLTKTKVKKQARPRRGTGN